MARPFASGTISFGLVSIPVKLYSATEASEKISFNMLHRDCGTRVQQQYICRKDERTIEREEIVKGYEFSKGQYVTFSEEELKALEERATQAIEITEFLPSSQIDPIYFAKAYYLAPDRGAERAYSLLGSALRETKQWAIGKFASRGKGYLVVLRPLENGLVMQQLFYPNEIRSFSELDITDATVKPQELQMAIKLAELGAAEEFHPENYRDEVAEKVRALINQKIEGGQEITSADAEEPRGQVIDLMEALRASLAKGNVRPDKKVSKLEAVPDERKPATAGVSGC
jgi:DNA end-binding protein Ku